MDRILDGFLRLQQEQGAALDEASDIFSLTPIAGDPPWRFLLEFRCAGLVCVDGRVEAAERCVVGVTFAPDHLIRAPEPPRFLTWLKPQNAFHPNVRFPWVCLGDIAPGTGIVDIAHRLYEVVSYQKFTPVEGDALNKDACIYAREHMDSFPVDARPLRRPASLPAASAAEAGS